MAGVDEKQGGRRPVREYRTDRVAALSDGVFAIAATLLALDIRLPQHWMGRPEAAAPTVEPGPPGPEGRAE